MRFVLFAAICIGLVACNRVDPPAAPAESSPAGEAPRTAEHARAFVEITGEQLATAPSLSGACNLEAIGGVVVPDMKPIEVDGRTFAVSGWAIDARSGRPPAALELRAYSTSGDGRVWQVPLTLSVERADVQAAQGGSDELLRSGFAEQVEAAGLPAGRYLLRLLFRDGPGEAICDNGRAVGLK